MDEDHRDPPRFVGLDKYQMVANRAATQKPLEAEVPDCGVIEPVGQRRGGIGLKGDGAAVDLHYGIVIGGVEFQSGAVAAAAVAGYFSTRATLDGGSLAKN